MNMRAGTQAGSAFCGPCSCDGPIGFCENSIMTELEEALMTESGLCLVQETE